MNFSSLFAPYFLISCDISTTSELHQIFLTVSEMFILEHNLYERIGLHAASVNWVKVRIVFGFLNDLMDLAAALEYLHALVLLLFQEHLVILQIDVAVRVYRPDPRLLLAVLHVEVVIIFSALIVPYLLLRIEVSILVLVAVLRVCGGTLRLGPFPVQLRVRLLLI